jgi:ketosteroid isomerase-like protein
MNDIEQIQDLEEEIFAAIQAKDAEAIGSVLAPDFLYRSPRAEDRTREEFLEGIRAIPGTIEEIGLQDVHTLVFGETAVVTGVQVASVRLADGNLVASHVAFTDVFHRYQGEWRLSLAYGIDLPGAPEPSTEQ